MCIKFGVRKSHANCELRNPKEVEMGLKKIINIVLFIIFCYIFRYAEMMGELVLPGGKILAECLEYDPTTFSGITYLFILSLV